MAEPAPGGLYRLPIGEDLYIVEGTPVLYHARSETLLFSDLHLGYEQAMSSMGVFLPRVQLKKTLSILARVFKVVRPKRVVIVGDVKHAFDRLLKQEAIEVSKLLAWLLDSGASEILVVRGNHDNYIQGVVKKNSSEFIEDYLEISPSVVATHGHNKVETAIEARTLIIGHEHPAFQINVGGSRIKYPTFLLVPLEYGNHLVVLPAMGIYQTGNPISLEREAYLSPYMRDHGVVEEALPIISDESVGVMPLPPLRESKHYL